MSYLLDDQGSNAWEDIFPSEREERERKQKIRQKIQILEVLRELEKEGGSYYPHPHPQYYLPPPPTSCPYYPPSCPVVENMKISITSDPLDKIYTDKDKTIKKKGNTFHGKVHTINDLPKEDLLTELFGKEKEKDKVEPVKQTQTLFNAGRRVRDGAIVYQAPTVSSALSWFSSPNFEIYICISLVIIFFGILIGKYIGDSLHKKRRPRQEEKEEYQNQFLLFLRHRQQQRQSLLLLL